MFSIAIEKKVSLSIQEKLLILKALLSFLNRSIEILYIIRVKNRHWPQVHLLSGTCSLSSLFLSLHDAIQNVRKTTTRPYDETECPTGNV